MDFQQAIAFLRTQDMKILQYTRAISIITTDGETVAPRESYITRGMVIGQLVGAAYDLVSDPQVLEASNIILAAAEPSERDHRLATVMKEGYEDATKIPKDDLVAYHTMLSEANVAWREAKQQNDFPRFAPFLEKIIACNRKFAQLKHPDQNPYDAMLNEYEKGMSQQVLDPFFALLKEKLTPLVLAIGQKDKPDNRFIKGVSFPVDKQKQLSAWLMQVMGMNPDRCVLLESEHPFTSSASIWDARITTHYYDQDVLSSMYSVIHEGGHALYEMGIDEALMDSQLGTAPFLGIHESQSRFYENILGRSAAFVDVLHGKMRELFSDQMDGVTADMLHRAVNRVEPSLIRTEADELTYPMHIMIRYELEKQLVAGTLSVEALPARWNEMYKAYLGVDVPDDSRGVLQDIHWSGGSFGYFPTYALGSAYGAQMLHAMAGQVDVDAAAKNADFTPITAWLRERIHQYGALRLPARLLQEAVGAPFDPTHYVDYLTGKFSALYQL